MDPVTRVRDFLRDNVGHLTRPGNPSFDHTAQRWLVPICFRTERGDVVIGDVELDRDGHVLYAPSREELHRRASEVLAKGSQQNPEDENQFVQAMYPHVMEVFGREGWDDPAMDIYNDLDPRRQR